MSVVKLPYFDVIFASDIYVLGGTNAVLANYADYFSKAGVTLAVLPMHLPHATDDRPIYAKIREKINSGKIHVIEKDCGHVACELFIVDNPSLLHTPGQNLNTTVEANRRVIIVPFPPSDGRGKTYDPLIALNTASTISQGTFLWAPVSPLVRKMFTELYPYLPVTASDIRPILDPSLYRRRRRTWSKGKVVVGRHSRPHAEKWPSGRRKFLQIYPADPAVDIRLLGIRTDQLRLMIGTIPSNYRLYDYDEINVANFLNEIDLFLYFNNDWWIEALGIVILEAMLSKIPCILPHYMQKNFGEFAIYCNPSNAWATIISKLQNPDELQKMVDRAHEFVSKTYSMEAFSDWLAEIRFSPANSSNTKATRLDSCHLIDLANDTLFNTFALENIALSIEKGERCAIAFDAKTELCAYARAFILERKIPVINLSPNMTIVSKKLCLHDPFLADHSNRLRQIKADAIEIILNAPPNSSQAELLLLFTESKNIYIRTWSRSSRIWTDQNIPNKIVGTAEAVVTEETIAKFASIRPTTPRYVGVYCEAGTGKIQAALERGRTVAKLPITVFRADESQKSGMNFLKWIASVHYLQIVTENEAIEQSTKSVITLAQALSIPFSLVNADDERGFRQLVRIGAGNVRH